MEIELRALGGVIAQCWEGAEAATIRAVAEEYPDPAEEQITFLFGGKLRTAVREASSRREFERAFLEDLRRQVPSLASNAHHAASGLIARVNLHSRQHEGRRSGSDLGIIITRPSIRGHAASSHLEVVRDQARALMAQAKLNKRKTKDGRLSWGRLTKTQKRLIPEHQEYYALLLYQLEGVERSTLTSFQWQTCMTHTVPEIEGWLRTGTFPNELSSADVIHKLSIGALGTDVRSVIERFVDPTSSQPHAIEIRVFWPKGKGPPPPPGTALQRRVAQEVRQFVRR